MHWGVDFDVWQLTMLASRGLLLVLVAEVAALVVFLRTRGADYGDGPPEEGRWKAQHPYGRLHFFASAALVSNVLFLDDHPARRDGLDRRHDLPTVVRGRPTST